MTTSKPKLLFLLSNDYGELANAIHFTIGCNFDAIMAAPARIYSANQGSQACRMLPYGSYQEILEIIDRENPDIVFLCSGYLYAINQLFSIEELSNLILHVQQKGSQLVTTDPFLGLTGEITADTFSGNSSLKQHATKHFTQIFEVLKEVIHLYQVDPRGLVRAPSLCAFNKNAILPVKSLRDSNQAIIENLKLHPDKPRWTFVLSMEDYVGQAGRLGKKEFENILVQKLHETAENGRQPILIAPDACLQSIQEETETVPDLRLQPFFNYEIFRALLFEAEYVFYWNILSNSILNRVTNQKPVFFFDKGHLAQAMPEMYDRAHQNYYANEEIPFLPEQAPLEKKTLELFADRQTFFRSTITDTFLQLPTPEQAVSLLLQEQGKTT